jgi:hypothetical protein
MTNQDLLEMLNSFDSQHLTSMLIFLDDGSSSGFKFLGFLKQFNFIESQNTLSLHFVDGNSFPLLYSLFSHYLISDVKAIRAANIGGIVLDYEYRERIVKVKTGMLELLRIYEPLLKRIEREPLT